MSERLQAATRAVRAAVGADPVHGAVMPPLYLSSTFAFAGFEEKRGYDYTRTANPTRDALGAALAALDGGARATVTSSGMAAIDLVCHLLGPGRPAGRAARLLRRHLPPAQRVGAASGTSACSSST